MYNDNLFLEALQEVNSHPTHRELYEQLSYFILLPNRTQKGSILVRNLETIRWDKARKIWPKYPEMNRA